LGMDGVTLLCPVGRAQYDGRTPVCFGQEQVGGRGGFRSVVREAGGTEAKAGSPVRLGAGTAVPCPYNGGMRPSAWAR
jgi:hypothetical protein